MNTFSAEAIEYLRKMLARQVDVQIKNGMGEFPMSAAWTELYNFTIEL